MPRHTQPREVAELKGATKHDPQRYRGEVAKSEQPLGLAPDHLDDYQKSVWFELESHSLPGVLTGADRFILEIAAKLLAQFRLQGDDFPAGKYSHLIGCLGRLGLSPADRQKFTTEEKDAGNPFANLEQ